MYNIFYRQWILDSRSLFLRLSYVCFPLVSLVKVMRHIVTSMWFSSEVHGGPSLAINKNLVFVL
jgi:hypothetical protein